MTHQRKKELILVADGVGEQAGTAKFSFSLVGLQSMFDDL